MARRPAPLPAAARFAGADIESAADLRVALRGVDAVVHLAAVPRPGVVSDEELFRINVGGCFNVHEAARDLGIRRVVSCGSTAVLGWDWGPRDVLPAYLPFDEDHPVTPRDAYGLSKQAGEAIARSFNLRCGMETVVLRAPWILAPEQLSVLRAQGGRRPDSFYHYAYVDARDLALAFRLALERPGLGHAVLFTAAGDTATAESLDHVLARFLPAARSLVAGLTGYRSGVSSARAAAVLGWRARRSWRDEPGGGRAG